MPINVDVMHDIATMKCTQNGSVHLTVLSGVTCALNVEQRICILACSLNQVVRTPVV